jgi:amidase
VGWLSRQPAESWWSVPSALTAQVVHQPPIQRTFDLQSASNPALINVMLSGQFAHNHYGPWLEGKAHRKVFELRAAYDRAFDDVDGLITPCAPTLPMSHPDAESRILEKLKSSSGVITNTCPFNITGHPAMSVPCGSAATLEYPGVRLPIGMQIVGKRWEDETVILAAELFEEGKRVLAF